MDDTRWTIPHQIKFKHRGAGTRILCLDGGGIRGIVELEVLRALEQALGNEIPIQAFFDLIVGTSTGGIIAIALGVQQWPVSQCIQMFTALCDHAYAPRMHGLPVLDMAATISRGSKYKTKAFHEALKETFGEKNYLFGGRSRTRSNSQTKVAVTSTSSTGGRAIVLANYRRKEDSKPDYEFERPHEPELEMRVWEAAAATSAAPTYFKPFVNPLTRRTYLDGALHNNNPARLANRERKLIWPEAADTDPDILLSLSTGQNRISILPKLSAKTTDWKTLQSSLQPAPVEKQKGFYRLLKSWSVLYSRVDDILNAEIAWAAFRVDVVPTNKFRRNSRRYIRFNPDLDRRAPSLDATDELRTLQSTVQKRLAIPHCRIAVEHVAHRLVASSFLLDVTKRHTNTDGSQCFICTLLCKFEDGTANLRGLGRFLRKTSTSDFRPFFVVRGLVDADEGVIQEFPMSSIDSMADRALFEVPEVTITVEDETQASNVTLVMTPNDGLEPDGFPLSGFPKILAEEVPSRGTPVRSRKHSTANANSSPVSLAAGRSQDSSNYSPSRSGSISLNHPKRSRMNLWSPSYGPLAGLKQLEREDTAPEVIYRPSNAAPQVSYRDLKGPNRFWAYIGPSHMAKNRHLYSPDVLGKFVPSIAAEPVELDGGDDTEVKRIPYAELATGVQKRTSIHHEVHAVSSPTRSQRERKDSVQSTETEPAVTETAMGDYTVRMPPLPFTLPPPFPTKKRGFDPGELEAAIEAAFG